MFLDSFPLLPSHCVYSLFDFGLLESLLAMLSLMTIRVPDIASGSPRIEVSNAQSFKENNICSAF